ncbi:MAG: alpha/beta fold hydrolase [Arcobacter sp.]|uniref:alpha/beta fold hydrolase n=1 Tax=Arcobacter sp. TaxID=1872629 RepID=UPI003D015AEB
MFKKALILSSLLLVSNLSLNAAKITENECSKKGENFIFAGNECIQYKKFSGEEEGALNIIVHGTWKDGTDTLARYAPFAEDLAMRTDITTIAVALPGYSGSSTNKFTSLSHDGVENLAAKKEYVEFLGSLVEALKEKYQANKLTYIGHSAGCMMGATLTGVKPDLINNIVCAGGVYNVHEKSKEKGLISIVDVLDNVSKNTKFVLVYGTADDISKPEVTKDFYKLAKEKGFDVKLVEAVDAPHIDLDMTTESKDAIEEIVAD